MWNEVVLIALGNDYEIGHTYFMGNKLDKEKLERIIESEIKPLAEQHLFAKNDEGSRKEIYQICKEILDAQDTLEGVATDVPV